MCGSLSNPRLGSAHAPDLEPALAPMTESLRQQASSALLSPGLNNCFCGWGALCPCSLQISS